MASTLEEAIALLGTGLNALARFTGPLGPLRLLHALGWELPPGTSDIGLAAIDVSGVSSALDAVARARATGTEDDIQAAYVDLLAAVSYLLDDLLNAADGFTATPGYLAATNIVAEFYPRLIDLVVADTVALYSPTAFAALQLLGLVVLEPHDADPATYRPAYVRQVVRWDRIPMLFGDPEGLFRDAYGWGTSDFRAGVLITQIAGLLQGFGVATRQRALPRRAEELLTGRSVPEADTDPGLQMFVSLIRDLGEQPVDVGLTLYTMRPTTAGGTDGGFGLSPYLHGSAGLRFDLTERLALDVRTSVDAAGGVAVVLRPHEAPRVVTDLLRAAGQAAGSADLMIGLRYTGQDGGPLTLIEVPGTLVVRATAVSIAVGTRGGDFTVQAGIEGGTVAIPTTNADGFLAQILPADGLSGRFDLGVLWSAAHGVRFDGGGALAVTLPVQQQLGPFRLDSITLELGLGGNALTLAASVGGGFTLGPVGGTVSGIGAIARLRLAAGNLGPLDLGFAFKPPTGAGLSIDAGAVTGGGFLIFDPDQALYAGGVHLQFENIALNAIGLLNTRLPDGSRGFSLLVLVQATGFTPIQLGFGFALTGVGGLLGINRDVDVDALRSGVRTRALDSIMFMRDDPIPRATQIVSTLQTIFPPARDRFIFGPMVQLAWGTPALVTAEVALVLALPSPLRLILIGRLRCMLPDPAHAILRLQLDSVGVIDFGSRELSVDATLYDSGVGPFSLSGDMALRASWGAHADFALSVGGFHPAFRPSANFPALRRLTVALSTSDNPRLRAEMYFAITANTVQTGAKLEARLSAGKFAIEGGMAFDALVYFSPFGFQADIGAHLALKVGSRTLMGIDIGIHLTGPNPWHLACAVRFRILFFKVTVRFSATVGDARDLPQVQREPVWPRLSEALAAAGNWVAELPPDAGTLAVLRPPTGADQALVHPVGAVRVSQRVVPLDRTIAHFGAAPPADYSRFGIVEVAGAQAGGTVYDSFAPGQYLAMSDAQRLAAPGFERMPAGVRLVAPPDAAATGPVVDCPLAFETIVMGAPERRTRAATDSLYRPEPGDVAQQAQVGPAANAAIRTTGRRAYAAGGEPPRIADPAYRPAYVADLTDAQLPTDGTYSAALEATRGRPEVQVVRTQEVVS